MGARLGRGEKWERGGRAGGPGGGGEALVDFASRPPQLAASSVLTVCTKRADDGGGGQLGSRFGKGDCSPFPSPSALAGPRTGDEGL